MEERREKLRPPAAGEEPLLLYNHHGSRKGKFQTFCTMSQPSKSYVKSIPELRDKLFCGCSHGCWLILRDEADPKAFSLFSLVTSETITLPPLEGPEWWVDDDDDHHEFICSCALTSPPHVDQDEQNNNNNNNDSVLVLVCQKFVFSICVNRKQQVWATQRLELKGKEAIVSRSVLASCNGVLYGVALTEGNNSLFAIDVVLVDGQSRVTLRPLQDTGVPNLPSGSSNCHHIIDYLLESCGVVYLICVFMRHRLEYKQITSVLVWELDLGNMKWIRVDSLGDRAFFLDNNNACTWCWTSTGGDCGRVEGNCVYFMAHDDIVLHLYRLEERSLTSFLPPQHLAKTCYRPTWVLPRNQRLTENNDEEDLFSLLPTDLLPSISKHLHLFDYLNLRSTCKTLQSALPLAQWRSDNESKSSSALPLFMFSDNNKGNGICKLMDPRRSDSCSIFIPMLSGGGEVFIDYSKNGWLLIGIGTESAQYFNPFTRVALDFPPDEDLSGLESFGISSTCRTSSGGLTNGFFDECCPLAVGLFLASAKTWDIVSLDCEDEFLPGSSCCPVLLDGVFYILDKEGYLCAHNFLEDNDDQEEEEEEEEEEDDQEEEDEEDEEDEENDWLEIYDRPQTKDTSFESYHLVECGGELLSVFIGYMGDYVQVFKFNRSTTKWVQVKSLGDHILFIGPTSSFSAVAPEDGMRNRIYLPRLRGNGIVFYSLDTRKFHTCSCEDSMEDLSGTKKPLVCCWV